MCLLGICLRELRFLAVPVASKLVFTGPVGSSHSHARRSGRRLNPNHNTPDACVHGVVDVHSAVVRTTETMVIHSSSLCRGENHEMMTKRIYVFATMRVLVLGQLQRPETERTRGAGWQSQTVACGGGGEVARFDMARDHTPVFQGNRRRM